MQDRRLSAGTLAAYGGPVFAVAYLLFFVQFYFLKFATDVLLLSPAVVSVLFGAAKLWDGVSGPLVGSWSDRARSRWGRRRPFLFGCAAAARARLRDAVDGAAQPRGRLR